MLRYLSEPKPGVLGKQLLRSGTSIGANYREAQRARSRAEFISKVHIGMQEAEETAYWLELMLSAGICDTGQASDLLREANELCAVLTAISVSANR